MKTDDLIRVSLGTIDMPPGTKQRIWDKIEAAGQGKEHSMGRKRRRWIYAAAAVAVAAAALIIGITAAKTPEDDMDVVAATPVPDVAQNATGDGQPAGDETQNTAGQDSREDEQPSGGGDTVYLKHLIVDGLTLDVPDILGVYEDVPISIFGAEMAEIEDNATAYGWQNIVMEGYSDGLYFIGSKPHEASELGLDSSSELHHQLAEAFMEESGLLALLEAKGMTLVHENTESYSFADFYWSVLDGCRASGFVRLNFEEEGVVSECKIYAVKSTVLWQSATIPLHEAAKKAFFVSSESAAPDPDAEYIADKAELKYVSGIPIYEMNIPMPGMRGYYTAYALAVDESVVLQNETAAAAFDRFLEYGF